MVDGWIVDVVGDDMALGRGCQLYSHDPIDASRRLGGEMGFAELHNVQYSMIDHQSHESIIHHHHHHQTFTIDQGVSCISEEQSRT